MIKSLKRIYTKLIDELYINYDEFKTPKSTEKTKEAKVIFKNWLHQTFVSYLKELLQNLTHDEPCIQIAALEALMHFEKKAGQSKRTKALKFYNMLLPWIITILINSSHNVTLIIDDFIKNYLIFRDVSFYTLKNIHSLLLKTSFESKDKKDLFFGQNSSQLRPKKIAFVDDEQEFNESVFKILSKIRLDNANFLVEFEEANLEKIDAKLLDISLFKKQFTSTWIEFMKRNLSLSIHKRILNSLENQIIPNMENPIFLFDYLSECFSSGHVLSVLSLPGLFILIRKFNVEYPNFFKILYSLLTSSIFYLKHRIRFFQLTLQFLESPHLPVYLIAAFLKRLSRLSLTAPPQGCILIVSMVYNILLKHSSCRIMIHKEFNSSNNTQNDPLKYLEQDPYKYLEQDPLQSNALDSSLWELQSLQNHYIPFVASSILTLFGSSSFLLTKMELTDVVNESFDSIFQNEIKYKNKNIALNFQVPESLFPNDSFPSFDSHINMVRFKDESLADNKPSSYKKRKSFSELKASRGKKRNKLRF